MGECFVSAERDVVEKILENEKVDMEKTLSARQHEADQIQTRMKQLKAQLYAKFGRAINLEETDD